MGKPRHTKIAGGVVQNRSGDILLVNQRGDSWSFPKGHVEKGEKLLDAARREIYEETGIRKLVLKRRFSPYMRRRIGKGGRGEDPSECKHITLFLFATDEVVLQSKDLEEHPEARWIPKENVRLFLTHPKDRAFLKRIVLFL